MGFKNNTYATIIQTKNAQNPVQIYEKYATAYITTSKKNRLTNKREVDFSGFIRFIGMAFEKIKNIEILDKTRIRLTEVEVTTRYDIQKQQNYTNFICWDFEIDGKVKTTNTNEVDVIDEEKPFDPLADNSDLPF